MARPHPVPPRDAASLVVARGGGADCEVLLGRREPRDRFMPDVFVFPGGRVDAGDAVRPAESELRADVAARLERHSTPARARALAVAAVRETWEETGLVLGRASRGRLRPALHGLDFVARAITPALNPTRYHARFFLADAADVGGRLRGNGELLDLGWYRVDEALSLPIIDVTAFVLREVVAHREGRPLGGVPLVHYRGTRKCVRRDTGRRR